MSSTDPQTDRKDRIVDGFQGYAAGQSELGREFARRSGQHASDAAAMVEILRAEQRQQPLTPARLAERIGLTSGATSILLNRLEQAGHIVRQRGHADRRMVTLHSTPTIHDTADAFFAPLRAQIDAVMDRYSADELEVVEAFVSDLRRTIDAYMHPDPSAGSE